MTEPEDITEVQRLHDGDIIEPETGQYIVISQGSHPRTSTVREITGRFYDSSAGEIHLTLGELEEAVLDRDMDDYLDLTEEIEEE